MNNLIDYGLFKYLWLIILMPKTIQFGIFLVFNVLFILKSGLTLKKESLLIVGFIYVYTLAIIHNIWLNPQLETERIFAALNVVGMWFFALIAYGYYSVQKIDFSHIKKYMYINMLIMIALSLVFLLLPNGQNIRLLGRSLSQVDWLTTGRTERFNAFLEYANLIALFYLLTLPFALLHVQKKGKFFMAIFIALSFIPMIVSNSRVGLAAMVIAVAFFVFFEFLSPKLRALFLVLTPFILVFVMMFFSSRIAEILSDFFNSRSGSNVLRFRVYEESLRLVFQRSPFIGLGIREEFSTSAHLGTHSTYISIIFRTGILGSVLFFTFFFKEMGKIFRLMWQEGHFKFLGFLLYFLIVMFIEDIDGSNWPLFLMFSYAGILAASSASASNKQP